MKKFKNLDKGNLKHLYRNKSDKTCFAHNTAYSDSKDLVKRTVSDKILKDKAYKIGYQRGLASMVNKLFEKKTGLGSKASVNEELA